MQGTVRSDDPRYEDGERQSVAAYRYDRFSRRVVDEEWVVYQRPLIERLQSVFLTHALPLPDLPVGEYYAKQGEHMPLLAFKFLDDSTSWHRLAEVNSHVWYPLDMEMGDPVRIPGT